MTSAEGRASARARRGSALYCGWSRSSLPPAKEMASGGRTAPLSALGALGVATLALLGVSAAGTDLIQPAAAHTPMHLTLAAAKWMQAADTATARLAPAALMPAVPGRVRLVFSFSDVPPGEPQEAAWQEAVVVRARPISASSAAVMRLSPADLQPTPAPAPVMKPPRGGACRAGQRSAVGRPEAQDVKGIRHRRHREFRFVRLRARPGAGGGETGSASLSGGAAARPRQRLVRGDKEAALRPDGSPDHPSGERGDHHDAPAGRAAGREAPVGWRVDGCRPGVADQPSPSFTAPRLSTCLAC